MFQKRKNLSLLIVLMMFSSMFQSSFAARLVIDNNQVDRTDSMRADTVNELLINDQSELTTDAALFLAEDKELLMNMQSGPGLQVDASTDKAKLVEKLLWQGMEVFNVQLSGAEGSAGFFSGGENIIGFDEGVILSTGHIQSVIGPNKSDATGYDNGYPGDSDLNAIIDGNTRDAVVLEFDFIPETNLLTFEYVFASDEYNEYVGSGYNDVFAFFVNGNTAEHNVALIPNTTTHVAINTVNNGNDETPPSNSSYYRDNDLSSDTPINIEMDGLTVVLPIRAYVNPNVTNHIKLVIADTTDAELDSVVLIKAKSMAAAEPKPGTLKFKQSSFEVDENVSGGYATIEVSRIGGHDGELEAYYATCDKFDIANAARSNEDYVEIHPAQKIIFEDGVTSKSFQVQIIDDNIMEDDEVLCLTLANKDGEIFYGSADLIIIDNEKAPQIHFSSESYLVQEYMHGHEPNGNIASITVKLTGNIDALFFEPELSEPKLAKAGLSEIEDKIVCSVVYETSNGSALLGADYLSASGILTFSDYELLELGLREKTFDVIILDDTIYEGTETVNLTLREQSPNIINLGVPSKAILNIIDNETPPTNGSGSTAITSQKEISPATENLPADTLVNRMPGYLTLCEPVKITENKNEILLNYDTKKLEGKLQHTPRIYYWHADEEKWVALATYPAGEGKVKAINAGKYKGWFVVFGVIQPHFIDITNHWAEPIFNRMNGLQMIEGYHVQGQDVLMRAVRPEQNITRAEFTAFICRILNINPLKPRLLEVSEYDANYILKNNYIDADEIPIWVRQSVASAVKANLLPFKDDHFKANTPITRIEAFVMISRAQRVLKEFKTADLSSFKDANDISDDIKIEIVENVIQGYSDGTIKPNNELKRAEALDMLHKLFVEGMGW